MFLQAESYQPVARLPPVEVCGSINGLAIVQICTVPVTTSLQICRLLIMFRISCFFQETKCRNSILIYRNFSAGGCSLPSTLRTFRRFASFLQFLAILQIFAILPGKCFSTPMISYEKLLSVLVDGSVCHPPSIAGTAPEIKRM